MTVTGGNSLANTVSATPGGVGINQAINTASLSDVTDAGERDRLLGRPAADRDRVGTSCSAIVLVVWAFGWTGGKMLVERLVRGREGRRSAEQKAERAARRRRSRRRRRPRAEGRARSRARVVGARRASRERRTRPSPSARAFVSTASSSRGCCRRRRCSSPPGCFRAWRSRGCGGALDRGGADRHPERDPAAAPRRAAPAVHARARVPARARCSTRRCSCSPRTSRRTRSPSTPGGQRSGPRSSRRSPP